MPLKANSPRGRRVTIAEETLRGALAEETLRGALAEHDLEFIEKLERKFLTKWEGRALFLGGSALASIIGSYAGKSHDIHSAVRFIFSLF